MFVLMGMEDNNVPWYGPQKFSQIGIPDQYFYNGLATNRGYAYSYQSQYAVPTPGPMARRLREMTIGSLGIASQTEQRAPSPSEWSQAVRRLQQLSDKNGQFKARLSALRSQNVSEQSQIWKDLNAQREYVAGEMLAAQNYLQQNDPRLI